eukprot:3535788-Rhodomonas_salina.1
MCTCGDVCLRFASQSRPDGAEVVAEMQVARRLNTAQHSLLHSRLRLCLRLLCNACCAHPMRHHAWLHTAPDGAACLKPRGCTSGHQRAQTCTAWHESERAARSGSPRSVPDTA